MFRIYFVSIFVAVQGMDLGQDKNGYWKIYQESPEKYPEIQRALQSDREKEVDERNTYEVKSETT